MSDREAQTRDEPPDIVEVRNARWKQKHKEADRWIEEPVRQAVEEPSQEPVTAEDKRPTASLEYDNPEVHRADRQDIEEKKKQ